MLTKPVRRCEKCGQVVTKEKFLNKTFYLTDDSNLAALVNEKKARAVACLNCLQVLEAASQGRLEKTEFDHLTIFTLRPTLMDTFKERLTRFFNGK